MTPIMFVEMEILCKKGSCLGNRFVGFEKEICISTILAKGEDQGNCGCSAGYKNTHPFLRSLG